MRKTRAEIENEIRFEMYWLKRIAQEINDYNTKGAAISKAAQFHIANAVLPAKSRIEYAKALRLRIRLFRTTRNCVLPNWVRKSIKATKRRKLLTKREESLDNLIDQSSDVSHDSAISPTSSLAR